MTRFVTVSYIFITGNSCEKPLQLEFEGVYEALRMTTTRSESRLCVGSVQVLPCQVTQA